MDTNSLKIHSIKEVVSDSPFPKERCSHLQEDAVKYPIPSISLY